MTLAQIEEISMDLPCEVETIIDEITRSVALESHISESELREWVKFKIRVVYDIGFDNGERSALKHPF